MNVLAYYTQHSSIFHCYLTNEPMKYPSAHTMVLKLTVDVIISFSISWLIAYNVLSFITNMLFVGSFLKFTRLCRYIIFLGNRKNFRIIFFNLLLLYKQPYYIPKFKIFIHPGLVWSIRKFNYCFLNNFPIILFFLYFSIFSCS